jgi:Phage integrase family
LLWPSRSGGYLGPPVTYKSWLSGAVDRCMKADPTFPRVTAHDLRHTAASLAISAGANPKVVQRMLGHASAAMTLDVYANLFDSDLDSVAESVAKCGHARRDRTLIRRKNRPYLRKRFHRSVPSVRFELTLDGF